MQLYARQSAARADSMYYESKGNTWPTLYFWSDFPCMTASATSTDAVRTLNVLRPAGDPALTCGLVREEPEKPPSFATKILRHALLNSSNVLKLDSTIASMRCLSCLTVQSARRMSKFVMASVESMSSG